MSKKKSLQKFKNLKDFFIDRKLLLILFFIFSLHLFFRFYELEARHQFAWDQVDNAWVAKNIIIEHRYPLLGMVAKQDSGINIGPVYYYLNAIFYWFFDLDPIASPIFAGLTSIFTFFVLYYVAKKIFSSKIALISIFLYAVSFFIITQDRVQWPAAFIPSVSLIIFYCSYRIVKGNEKYILPLAVILGFSFNIHFTSVFYPIIVLFLLPFFPRTKLMLKYSLLSLPLFFVWIVPILISVFQSNVHGGNYVSFIQNYYHGIHFRRILQLLTDSLIEFETWLWFPFLKFLKFILIPLFFAIYFFEKPSKEKFLLCYLIFLWFFIPLIVLASYKGDLSNYYYSSTRLLSLLIFSCIVFKLMQKNFILKLLFLLFFVYYFFANIQLFLNTKYQGLAYYKNKGYKQVKESRGNEFIYGAPESYMYYYFSRKLYK